MDVHLLIYDLSRGLARQMSMGLLGFQLDAIYHTSILLNGLEYVYDGGIVAIQPGSSHLGQPLEQKLLGTTHLPLEVIEEYLDSLRVIYTVEAYDLWRHNCNNFSNDVATFLVGRGIPKHIINMPTEVLASPLGRMLMPALNQQIGANKQSGGILGIQQDGSLQGSSSSGSRFAGAPNGTAQHPHPVATVQEVSNLGDLDSLLWAAQKSCVVVFFTSATCPPCRTLYPLYSELAEMVGSKGVVIKTDISVARDVAARYSITATPTFITFLKGEQENRWMGADPATLAGNVRLLVSMAWPPHPHQSLRLPSIAKEARDLRPALFSKVPPLQKLLAKIDATVAEHPAVRGVVRFLEVRSNGEEGGAAASHLPDVAAFSSLVSKSVQAFSPDAMFPLVDLLRCVMVDPRFSGCLAEEEGHTTVLAVLSRVNGLQEQQQQECPYPLRLVTLQLACNLFSSTLFWDQVLGRHEELKNQVVRLVSSSLLDDTHGSVRVASASVLFNIALVNGLARRGHSHAHGHGSWAVDGLDMDMGRDLLPEEDQIELGASVVEAISQEGESREALEGMLLALGHLTYRAPVSGELADLMEALDARDTVLGKKKLLGEGKNLSSPQLLSLVEEVGSELLGSFEKK